MAMRPILFNTEMVRAILDGRKIVTRRIADINTEITCSDGTTNHDFVQDNFTGGTPTGFVCRKCGFGVAPPHSRVSCGTSLFRPCYWPGDILYVRETWCDPTPDQSGYPILYKADMPMHWEADDVEFGNEVTLKTEDYKWRPSIHMPKEYARIFIQVTSVRVERLQDITNEDALREGCDGVPCDCHNTYIAGGTLCCADCMNTGWKEPPVLGFGILWDSTIKPSNLPTCGWDANPWVWVIKFERISKEATR